MPASLCLTRYPSIDPYLDLTILRFDDDSLELSIGESPALSIPFESDLPELSAVYHTSRMRSVMASTLTNEATVAVGRSGLAIANRLRLP